MARVLGAEPDAFVREWERSAIARQTGGYPDIASNVRAICATLGITVLDERLDEALELRLDLYRHLVLPARRRDGDARGAEGARLSDRVDQHVRTRCSGHVARLAARAVRRCRGLLERGRAAKPDAAIYRYATDALGVDPRSCIYCGDGAYGELAGARGGRDDRLPDRGSHGRSRDVAHARARGVERCFGVGSPRAARGLTRPRSGTRLAVRPAYRRRCIAYANGPSSSGIQYETNR